MEFVFVGLFELKLMIIGLFEFQFIIILIIWIGIHIHMQVCEIEYIVIRILDSCFIYIFDVIVKDSRVSVTQTW